LYSESFFLGHGGRIYRKRRGFRNRLNYKGELAILEYSTLTAQIDDEDWLRF
jgi:hypothetical protein